jgi:hypothetical protein
MSLVPFKTWPTASSSREDEAFVKTVQQTPCQQKDLSECIGIVKKLGAACPQNWHIPKN